MQVMSTIESYSGFNKPEKVKVNDKLDMYIYLPIDLSQDYMVGLIRNFNFDIREPFLLTGETVSQIVEKLLERGLT